MDRDDFPGRMPSCRPQRLILPQSPRTPWTNRFSESLKLVCKPPSNQEIWPPPSMKRLDTRCSEAANDSGRRSRSSHASRPADHPPTRFQPPCHSSVSTPSASCTTTSPHSTMMISDAAERRFTGRSARATRFWQAIHSCASRRKSCWKAHETPPSSRKRFSKRRDS